MSLTNVFNMLSDKKSGDFVVIQRETLGTLLNLLYESVGDQGSMSMRLLETLFEEIEHKIVPYNTFQGVDYTVMLVGATMDKLHVKSINLIKDIRSVTSLGLREAKDIVDGIFDNNSYAYLKTNDASKVFKTVSAVRGYGYHVVVYKGAEVIYDYRKDDDIAPLLGGMPVPVV